MFWIIISIIIFVIAGAVLGLEENEYGRLVWKFKKKCLFALLAFILLVFGMIVRIPANTVGIKYNTFSGVQEETLSEGIKFKTLFDKVYKISTEVQTATLEDITSQTLDSQYVNTDLNIQYKVNETTAYQVFRNYRNLDRVNEQLIPNTVQRIVESVTTLYNVYDALGGSRNEIYQKIELALEEELSKYGIQFVAITINDMDAGEAIEGAIAKQAIAKQEVETAEQERQKAVIEAQAELEKSKLEAEAKVVAAEGEAKANKLLIQSLSEEVLEKEWIEKWNGVLPEVVGGDNTVIKGLTE